MKMNCVILTNVKIFQFPHSTCRIIGQHALCGKEKLIVSEYKKKQSVDRIEVTFNKYFANTKVLEMPISAISDADIIKILHWIIYSYPHMTLKEFAKVMQVMKSPWYICVISAKAECHSMTVR